MKHSILLIATVVLASCAKEQRGDCFMGAGEPSSELRELSEFRSIVLDDRIDLELHQDTTAPPSLLVEAGSNLLERITTEVRNGELYIGSDLKCNWVRKLDRPKVRLTFPQVERITYRGVGDITATTPIHGRTFRLEQWDGHGTVRLQLHVDTAWIGLHTGVGDAHVSGSVGQLSLYTLNFGHIDAASLAAREVLVNNSGSGDIRCRVSDALFVQVRNVGDVYYAGDPPTVDALFVGSGRLLRLD